MNVKFFVNVDSDNDAFQDGNAAAEVQRILLKIARQIVVSDGEVIKDTNGNTVGEWGLMTEDEEDDEVDAWVGSPGQLLDMLENESLFDREFSYPVEDFEL